MPGTRSWQAYAPGLSVLLLPSLLASLDDDTATRALLIGGLALAVLLVGARARLQAPLAIGATYEQRRREVCRLRETYAALS